jgi:hypothetical protein
LIDTLSVGVDRIQRNFEPLERQVETWRKTQTADATAKLIFYSALIDGKLEAPRSLLPESIGCISSRNIRNSRPGPCGVYRTPSPAPSKARPGAAVQSNGQAGRLSRTTAELTGDLHFNLARRRRSRFLLHRPLPITARQKKSRKESSCSRNYSLCSRSARSPSLLLR